MYNQLPILSLEIKSMKHVLHKALSEHSLALDKNLQEAVELYCTEDNLRHVVNQEAKLRLDEAVKEEVRAFFSHSGVGREAVKEAVLNYLNDWVSSNPY